MAALHEDITRPASGLTPASHQRRAAPHRFALPLVRGDRVPAQRACPRCGGGEVVEELLEPRGTLWTWTVQTFPTKAPYRGGGEQFSPYGVGYIELPGQLRVEARLTEHRPDRLRIGMLMELTTVPVPGGEAEGLETFAFAPMEDSG